MLLPDGEGGGHQAGQGEVARVRVIGASAARRFEPIPDRDEGDDEGPAGEGEEISSQGGTQQKRVSLTGE